MKETCPPQQTLGEIPPPSLTAEIQRLLSKSPQEVASASRTWQEYYVRDLQAALRAGMKS